MVASYMGSLLELGKCDGFIYEFLFELGNSGGFVYGIFIGVGE